MSDGPVSSRGHPRPDLAVVEFDGDLVVYDPERAASHVLTGGAVVVWAELERDGVVDIVERVADRVGLPAGEIADQVRDAVEQLLELGLLDDGVTT